MTRPIYYLPDAFTPSQRIHIGDMVSDESGTRFEVMYLWEPTVPGIGSARQRHIAMIRLALVELAEWRRLDALPDLGPHFVVGEPVS